MDVQIDLDAAATAYARDGWWVSPPLFDAAALSTLRAAMDRVLAGEHNRGRAPALALPFEPTPHDLRKIDNAWWADDDLAALATDPTIGTIARALLGADSVRLWQDQLLYKPPVGAAGRSAPGSTTIGWHQDWASWNTVASHGAFVTAWVAFDDVDDDNGAMQMLTGSHEWGLMNDVGNFFATDRDAQLEALRDRGIEGHRLEVRPESVVLQAGQVSFHHPLTFHGSGANTSDRLRRSLAIHLVDSRVTAVAEPGIWQHYNLDLFRRRGGELGEPYRFDDLCPVVSTVAAGAR